MVLGSCKLKVGSNGYILNLINPRAAVDNLQLINHDKSTFLNMTTFFSIYG